MGVWPGGVDKVVGRDGVEALGNTELVSWGDVEVAERGH